MSGSVAQPVFGVKNKSFLLTQVMKEELTSDASKIRFEIVRGKEPAGPGGPEVWNLQSRTRSSSFPSNT